MRLLFQKLVLLVQVGDGVALQELLELLVLGLEGGDDLLIVLLLFLEVLLFLLELGLQVGDCVAEISDDIHALVEDEQQLADFFVMNYIAFFRMIIMSNINKWGLMGNMF